MKRLASLLLALMFLLPATVEAAPKRTCAFSSMGWELDQGGSQCRKMARQFNRAVRRDRILKTTAAGCHSRKPGRVWRCTAQLTRTMVMPHEYARGTMKRRGSGWKAAAIRYPGRIHAQAILVPTGMCSIRAGGGLGCFGDAVPAKFTDGYLWMTKRSRVHEAEAGGMIGRVETPPAPLKVGERWVKRGVRCRVIRGGIKCQNRAGHGFRVKKLGYRTW